jgi:hypothetical protein
MFAQLELGQVLVRRDDRSGAAAALQDAADHARKLADSDRNTPSTVSLTSALTSISVFSPRTSRRRRKTCQAGHRRRRRNRGADHDRAAVATALASKPWGTHCRQSHRDPARQRGVTGIASRLVRRSLRS